MENNYDFLMKCNYKECEKKEDCARFEDPIQDPISLVPFQNICKNNNNYKWFFRKPKEEVIVSERE